MTKADHLLTVAPEVAAEAAAVLGLPTPDPCAPPRCPAAIKFTEALRAFCQPTDKYPDLVEFHIEPGDWYIGTGIPGPLLLSPWAAAAYVEAGLGHVPSWGHQP